MKRITFFKSLLVAAGLLTGASAWGYDFTQVASYNFEDGSTTPFTVTNGSTRVTTSILDDATEGSKVWNATSGTNLNGKDYYYATYNFSSLTSDASAVKVEFDYANAGTYSCFTLRDAEATPGHTKSGYSNGGAFINIGSMRVSRTDVFGVNGATVAGGALGTWYHAEIIVDLSTSKVNYTIKSLDKTSTIASATDVAYYSAGASKCTQLDLYGISSSTSLGSIDNIVISKYVNASAHNYTINAVCGSTTLAEISSGICAEGDAYSAIVNKVVSYNGNYYELSDASVTGYTTKTYTMGNTDEIQPIEYTLAEDIVFYREGETLSQSTSNTDCSGGAYSYYYAGPLSVSITEAGTYRLETNVVARNTNSSLEVYTANYNTSVAQIAKNCALGDQSCNFVAAAGSTMRVGGPYYSSKFQNSLSFDYILIRKIGTSTSVSGTITPAGWATFASSYPLDLSTISGGTAYYASETSGSTVTLTSTTATVPAGEGIMVKGTASETFTIGVAASGTAISGNLLKGQTTTSDVDASTAGTYHYVFGYKTADPTEFGFYNLATDTEVAAGKAYLETATELTGARLAIVFDDETTGIENLTPTLSQGEGAIYDLQGRRVAQPTKGLYIVNGKKVVIK